MKPAKTCAHPSLIVLAVCATFVLPMQSALAVTCPPGYASKGQACIPAPPHSYHPQRGVVAHGNVSSSLTANHLRHDPVELHKATDWQKVKPQPGAPVEHTANATEKHSIIFVGGKNTIHSRPVSSGHAALNTQPIPPGHSLRKVPHPGAPLETAGH